MTLRRAAGLIIYRMNPENRIEYLQLQTSYGSHHWTPPKGHVDPGESDFEAAVRETEEEAGFHPSDYDVVQDFTIELRYKAMRHDDPKTLTDKLVTYWLAKLKNSGQQVKLSKEHQAFQWAEVDQACQLVQFSDAQEALKKCQAKLEIV